MGFSVVHPFVNTRRKKRHARERCNAERERAHPEFPELQSHSRCAVLMNLSDPEDKKERRMEAA
jgi:hypothetical protein